MFDWIEGKTAPFYEEARQQATLRQMSLTKPLGALGRLEEIAIRLCAMQGNDLPRIEHVFICVFAGDHGVTEEGVSAFPQAVTAEMVRNFARGGAAISVLARELAADLQIVNLGTVNDPGPLDRVENVNIARGTANFCKSAAMTREQLATALQSGRKQARRARKMSADLFIGGEMGIGNTTSAAALASLLMDENPVRLAGPGTGLDAGGIARKLEALQRAIDLHKDKCTTPLETLRRLGGFEIAALAGAYIACAQYGVAVLVDGFISSVAALVASDLCQGCSDWFFYSHNSAEPGHRLVLKALEARPLLDLDMRLGEGSGAAVALPIMRLACALHNEMATFDEAGILEERT